VIDGQKEGGGGLSAIDEDRMSLVGFQQGLHLWIVHGVSGRACQALKLERGPGAEQSATLEGLRARSFCRTISISLIGRSVGLRIAPALLDLRQAVEEADLGALMAQIGVEEDRTEPVPSLRSRLQAVERLAE
jgi:hypothetical protein